MRADLWRAIHLHKSVTITQLLLWRDFTGSMTVSESESRACCPAVVGQHSERIKRSIELRSTEEGSAGTGTLSPTPLIER
eukprot:6102018-Prymnesium_polylepis.1